MAQTWALYIRSRPIYIEILCTSTGLTTCSRAYIFVGLPRGLFLLQFVINISKFLISFLHAICATNFIILNLIIVIILDKKVKIINFLFMQFPRLLLFLASYILVFLSVCLFPSR
jgi:hypothetical protein